MKRREVYDRIVEAFEQKYSWLGEDFAKEFLSTIASRNIQETSKPDFRVRRHLLLFWDHGWLKSHFLKQASNILGDELCMTMSDVSHAALRGTAEAGQFITPYTLKCPYGIATEFGQIVGTGFTDITQKLLNVLEEGMVTVSLAKIAYLPDAVIKEVTEKYGITFIDCNTFTYRTNWVLIAGTYNKKFLVDNAFESRFHILTPQKKLDSTLIKHVAKSPPFVLNQEDLDFVRSELRSNVPMDTTIKLPNEAYDHTTSMRDYGQLLSSVLCKRWWGVNMTNEEIIDLAKDVKQKHESVWKTADDKVFDAIEGGFNTFPEIMEHANLSKRQVYYSIKNIRAKPVLIGGKRVWEIM